MSEAEKRSVHTDALATLGTIITKDEKRDAIHLAVYPTVARVLLHPGADVGIDGTRNNPVGIVDPFLKEVVKPGEWFWLVVYPRQITSLRHVWSHPAFPEETKGILYTKEDSVEWLRIFCDSNDCVDYDSLIRAAENGFAGGGDEDGYCSIVLDGEYLFSYGRDAHCTLPPEFWAHIENVTGRYFPNKPVYFTCSC